MSFHDAEQAYLYGGGIQMEDPSIEEAEMDRERLEKRTLAKMYKAFWAVFNSLTEEEQQVVKGDLYIISDWIDEMLESV